MSYITIGKGESEQKLLLKFGNRHGLIAGATGTGKTVTLQTLAEGFSRAGVPVLMPDVKGDLSGLGEAGGNNPKIAERIKTLGLTDHINESFPLEFWDIFGEKGNPVRVTISEMGPTLLSRVLDLNDTQESVLSIAFLYADKQGLLLLDVKDLKATLNLISENAKELALEYGNVAPATVSTIVRKINALEQEGVEEFFAEPAIDLKDIIKTAPNGFGVVNILAADKLITKPKLYSAFLIYLLSELFETMPEAGDLEKPKFVIFFDEAHLMFENASKTLLDKMEQVVRLIRSKGVGVYFITQSPTDIPVDILGQLGNRVQHALRAFTPQDQKAVKTAAQTFRANPKFKTEDVITNLGVGEALISVLDEKGTPTVADRCLVYPPSSKVGPADSAIVTNIILNSNFYSKYKKTIDRNSAYEVLTNKLKQQNQQEEREQEQREQREQQEQQEQQQQVQYKKTANAPAAPRSSNRQGYAEAAVKSVIRTVGSSLGREIVRGILGSILGGKKR